MRSQAFIIAERKRRQRRLRRPATAAQRHRLDELARLAGVETPHVFWDADAAQAIKRLEEYARQPTLGPMG